jgi:hypothetical protein
VNALILLAAPYCHLCEHAREVLDGLATERRVAWREVRADSSEGHRLASAAPPLRPVLFTPDGRILGYGRLSAKRLRRELDTQAWLAGAEREPCDAAAR